MKNKFIIAFVFLAVLIGCKDDEYDAPNSFSDFGFYTGAGQQSDTLELNISNYLSFADLSQGYIEHNWSINKGNNFLEGPIASRDSIFNEFIIYDGDTITEDKTVHVLFNNPGYQKVRLRNVFKDSVAFRGNSFLRDDYIKAAVKEGDLWVLDTTIVVKVYAKIVPEIEVKQFGATVDHTTTDTIYVEAGDKVQFIDKTTIGEPTGRFWSISKTLAPGAVASEGDVVASSSAEVADIVFKKLGDFTASLTANRTGQNTPGASTKYVLTTPFKVIPSSQPFILAGTIAELEDETIRIPFNGEFVEFVDKNSFFEVKVNNELFNIASVSIDPTDATFLLINLEDPIYQDDVITVSLLPGSGITSTDTREPVVFTDEVVKTFSEEYFLSIGKFENTLGVDWTKPFLNESIEAITEVLIVAPPVGTASAVSPTGNVINLALNRTKAGTIQNNVRAESVIEANLTPGGKYIVKFKYFARLGSPNFLFRFSNLGGGNQLNFNPAAGVAENVDRWKEGELEFTALPTHYGKFSILSAWGAYADFYIDDIVVVSNEKRP
ncbi:hypothetical protein MPF19_16735 [Polaribacter sp. Z014]|uniref:hypothetical protein n=1 Tax=Polaribacter sp. Z014 TaxID=2927126 RepID=UPI0020205771|nr:hypothetical protein [Polaribacter sp. Z014]MCL7765072.1 hypothetical protein [Polaribacter sp. Z014]